MSQILQVSLRNGDEKPQDCWEVIFASSAVERVGAAHADEPTASFLRGRTEFVLPTSQVTRQELFDLVRFSDSVRLRLPHSLSFPDKAAKSGEHSLRAWTYLLISRVVETTGTASLEATDRHISASDGAASLEIPTFDSLESHARSAVAAVESIHCAAASATGADAATVALFDADALEKTARLYSHGGVVRRQLCDALTFAGAGFDFPWNDIRSEAESLAILYNFSPFQDTGSTVASKRLRVFSESFDVIACSFLQHKKQDPTVEAISRPYVVSKEFLPLTPSWASWPSFRAFAERAAAVAGERMRAKADYRRLYTRAMWAPSLYAGARVKFMQPDLPWTAEFSDPLSLDVEGAPRGGKLPRDAFTAPLIDSWEREFGPLDELDLTIFRFAELLAYAFADELIFTNKHQRIVMLESIHSPRLRERVASITTVSHHPTLDPGFYELERVDYSLDDDHVHLGYFGEFYTARGITEITGALRSLPESVRSRTRLHVFTNYIPESAGGVKPASFSRSQFDLLVQRTLDGVGVGGVEELVAFNSSLPYLKFLAVTQKLDCLIVTDAQSGTGHSVNPYLPSKWSDYLGSAARVWGLVEEESVLSTMDLDVRTPIGDKHAARAAIWTMVDEKFGPTTISPLAIGDATRGQSL